MNFPNKRVRAAILFADYGPYHVARIEALAQWLTRRGDELTAFRFCNKVGTYNWDPATPNHVETITLLKSPPKGKLNALLLAGRFFMELKRKRIQIILFPSYSPLPNTLCFLSARLAGSRLVLMTDSWKGTEATGKAANLAKRFFVSLCRSALVAGHPQMNYVSGLGMPKNKIFLGYDVVDVPHFQSTSAKWKAVDVNSLSIPNLPERYFLNLGRFIPKKNLILLIEAYHKAVTHTTSSPVSLVFVGEGPMLLEMKKKAEDLGLSIRDGMQKSAPSQQAEVVFYPFQQSDLTPLFFSRSEAFILPSLYEEWGLVVNEAQACGAPVIVSKNVGSAQDLVVETENGFTFFPTDVEGLAALMRCFLDDPLLRNKLGAAGQLTSNSWTPDRFAEGALHAIDSALH